MVADLEPNRCVGTDIAFGLACSFVGGSLHMMLGHFERVLLLPMGLGGLLGVYLDTKLTRIVNPKPLRLVISAMLLVVALNLLYRSFTNG
ncbi:MAG: TSUP family transporter [Aquificota bacterium]|nr:MAG: TSUP family transporter [Aquificota bacterium]